MGVGEVGHHLLSHQYDDVRRMSYVTLDVNTWEAAVRLVDEFGEAVTGYKVGLELFHAVGSRAIDELTSRGKRVFLDVKLHDIPNTVAGALRAICRRDVEMVNIHASGGRKMMEAAREAVNASPHRPLLIAVTVLTSLGDEDVREIGYAPPAAGTVLRLAQMASESGLDGVVASAHELSALRALTPETFEIVVPGTRPAGGDVHDQARTLTPGEAVRLGASRLVIGRAVTGAEQRLTALRNIWDDMNRGLTASRRGNQG